MSYTRPAYNAADVSWQSSSAYTRLAYNAADVAFFSAGLTEITTNISSAILHGYVRTTPAQVYVFPTSVTVKSNAINGLSTVTLDTSSFTEYSVNEGGRLSLLAYSTYTPPDGGNIQLFSATGYWVLAREPKPTVSVTTILTGASVIGIEPSLTVSAISESSGSIVTSYDSLPTLSSTGTLSGSAVTAIESKPTVSFQILINASAELSSDFPILRTDILIASSPYSISANNVLPEFDFAMGWARPLSVNTLFTAPTASVRWSLQGTNSVDTDFTAPTSDANIVANGLLTVDAVFADPITDIYGVSGYGLTVNGSFTAPILDAVLQPIDTLDLNVTVDTLSFESGIIGQWFVDQYVPVPLFEGSLSSGLIVNTKSVAPTLSSLITQGLSLSTSFTAPQLEATFYGGVISVNAIFSSINTEIKIDISGCSVNQLIPELSAHIEIADKNYLLLDSNFANLLFEISINNNLYAADNGFPIFDFEGLINSGIYLEADMPLIKSDVRTYTMEFV